MGKRKRYRLREVKFGRKYALKYGSTFKDSPVDEPLEESSVVTELTTAAPAPPASEDSTATDQTWWPLGEGIKEAPAPKKKRVPRKTSAKKETPKKTTTTRKTTRKRATHAKTDS